VKFRALVAILAALGLAGLPRGSRVLEPGPPSAWAQGGSSSGSDSAAEAEQRKHIEELRRQAAENRRRAELLKGKEKGALTELKKTDTRLRSTRTTIQKLGRRERNLQGRITVVRSNLRRSEVALEDRRSLLSERLRGLYKIGRTRELGYLLGSESFAQLFVRLDYLVRVARQDRVLLLGIRHEKERITATREKLDLTLTDVEKTQKQKQGESQELARLRKRKQSVVSSIQNDRKTYEAAAAELERTARGIQRVLDELERRRREEAEARKRGLAPGQPVPLESYRGNFAAAQGKLTWPVRGELVGRFGNEKHPKFGTVTFNSGVDIAAPLGTDVHAVARGRVDFVNQDYGSYGEILILNHGDGYYTLYAHLSAVTVSRPQEVESGQVIGRVGDTGSLKGSILHFEVRKGGRALDPLDWLR
jgi:septal ring factor EnvC (AmiA/AmiB activator)